ncbi:MAG: hypothetical protein PHZ04_01845 [Patescibacteria group bacterium]|nr:hypothetical protein [Patescibacteria group bacterium]MDD5294797.1 hypothetical protein [Patescibacteria group bacterium]MDD5554807.1 hypothetical protein [Patescibacteria group bacterium]
MKEKSVQSRVYGAVAYAAYQKNYYFFNILPITPGGTNNTSSFIILSNLDFLLKMVYAKINNQSNSNAFGHFLLFLNKSNLQGVSMLRTVSRLKTAGNIPGNGKGNGKNINRALFLDAVAETIEQISLTQKILLVCLAPEEKIFTAVAEVKKLIRKGDEGITLIPRDDQKNPVFPTNICRFAVQPDGRVSFCGI